MKGHGFPVLIAFVVAAMVIVASVLANGCGGIDCTETATCPSLVDGASDAEGGGGAEAQTGTLADASDADSTLDAPDGEAAFAGPDVGDESFDSDIATDSSDASGEDAGFATCSNGSSCVKAAPAGWFGPGALFDGAFTSSPPACVAPYGSNAFNLNAMPTSPSPSCGCSCGAVNGGCTNPTIAVSSDNQCGVTNDCGTGGAPTCTVADGARCAMGGLSASVTALPQPTSTGACNASVTTRSIPMAQWTRTGEACTASRTFTDAGCASDSVCAADPPAIFQTKLCVWKALATDCSTPALSGYSLAYHYYSRMTDTRACAQGTCGCNTASVSACTLTSATAYRVPSCGSGPTALTNLGLMQCNFSGNLIAGLTTNVSTTGSCATNGSAGTSGAATPDNTTEMTVCCMQ
jgi:hypothetical protein